MPIEKKQLIIDTVRHWYTGNQMLDTLMHMWRIHGRDEAVFVLAARGSAAARLSMIRVSLSKARKQTNTPSYFGIKASEVFPWTHDSGAVVDAIAVRYRETTRQKTTWLLDQMLAPATKTKVNYEE